MTIRFAQASNLKKLFDAVYIPPIGEALSANACVLIEQPNFSTTVLTTIESGKGVFSRKFIHNEDGSGGEVRNGETLSYLVDSRDFKALLAKVGESAVTSVTIKSTRGLLSLLADHYITDAGETKERGRKSIRQYPGAITDFGPIIEPENRIAVAPSKEFDIFISLLNDYGDFATDKAFDGDSSNRDVLLEISPQGKIKGVTSYKGAQYAFINAESNISCNNSESVFVSIEGRHLKKLLKLDSEGVINEDVDTDCDFANEQPINNTVGVSIYLDEIGTKKWITFEGNVGRISIIAKDPSSQFLNEYKVFNNQPVLGCELQAGACRSLDINHLMSAVILQLPTDSVDSKKLVLVETPPHLTIMPASNIRGGDRSLCDIDPEYIQGDWLTLLTNGEAVKQSLKLLKLYITKTGLETTNIVLKQLGIINGRGRVHYRICLSTVQMSELVTLKIMLASDRSETSLNFIDSEE
jgi:hypothetical protein